MGLPGSPEAAAGQSRSIQYRELDGYKYQLARPYSLTIPGSFGLQNVRKDRTIAHPKENPMIALTRLQGSPGSCLLEISEGYAWDGPSGPTIDTKNFMRGALVHDALYQLMRERLVPVEYKDDADRVLQAICREDGMSRFRAWYVYQSVKRFAGFAISARDEEPIEVLRMAP